MHNMLKVQNIVLNVPVRMVSEYCLLHGGFLNFQRFKEIGSDRRNAATFDCSGVSRDSGIPIRNGCAADVCKNFVRESRLFCHSCVTTTKLYIFKVLSHFWDAWRTVALSEVQTFVVYLSRITRFNLPRMHLVGSVSWSLSGVNIPVRASFALLGSLVWNCLSYCLMSRTRFTRAGLITEPVQNFQKHQKFCYQACF